MKPRNAKEREVVALSDRLSSLTEAQQNWCRENVMEHLAFVTTKTGWCSTCGHVFPISPKDYVAKNEIECPHCHRKLKVIQQRKFKWMDDAYAQFITTCHGWQVIRYVYLEWDCEKGQEARLSLTEVMQKWCRPGDKTITLGGKVGAFPYQLRCPFSRWSTELSVKESDWYTEWMKVHVYPRTKVLPLYRKMGFDGKTFDELNAEDLLCKTLTHPFTEMLYKTRQIEMLRQAVRKFEIVRQFWPSIRVALRHHFRIDSLTNYLDYLYVLKKLQLDLRNPKYVAPADWDAMHSEVLEMDRRRIRRETERLNAERIRREEEEKMRHYEESKTYQSTFEKRIKRFAKLDITDGTIEIKPLMTIQEFFEEGTEMDHCVFARDYFKDKDSLILSAKIDGMRIETIEVDLNDFTVAQSQGKHNIPSKHHSEILALMRQGMPVIQKMAKRRKTVRQAVQA